MVRALLDGSKTRTRRLIKVQPPATARDAGVISSGNESNGEWSWLDSIDLMEAGIVCEGFRCPYGIPGDQLWVRENWRTYESLNHCKPRDIAAGAGVQYEAGGTNVYGDKGRYLLGMGKLRPSMFMPRWASRTTLEIVSVRVERLQDISEADAIAEGIKRIKDGFERYHPCPTDTAYEGLTRDPVLAYRGLWEYINGAGSWDANPWVWVVEFQPSLAVEPESSINGGA